MWFPPINITELAGRRLWFAGAEYLGIGESEVSGVPVLGLAFRHSGFDYLLVASVTDGTTNVRFVALDGAVHIQPPAGTAKPAGGGVVGRLDWSADYPPPFDSDLL